MTFQELVKIQADTAARMNRFGPRLAEDAASEAIARLLSYEGRVSCPSAFCYITAKNWCLDQIARWEKRVAPLIAEPPRPDDEDARIIVVDLLALLSENEREVARGIMRSETSAETGDRLGVSDSTVRRHRRKMRSRARNLLD